jgi:hypothetical protein
MQTETSKEDPTETRQVAKERLLVMATKKFIPFEKSSKDKEPKGMKEGSRKEESLDRKQAKSPTKKKC